MKMRTELNYVDIAWKWLSNGLDGLMTDQWFPKVADDSKDDFVIVSGSLIDKGGENRSFSVLIERNGMVNSERSYVSPKMLTTR